MNTCRRRRAWLARQDGMALEMLVVALMLMSIFALVLNLAATGVLLGKARRATDSALKNSLKVCYTPNTDGTVAIGRACLAAELGQLLADDLNLNPGTLTPKRTPALIQSLTIQQLTVYNPVPAPFTDPHGSRIRMPTATADVSLTYTSLFQAAGGATGSASTITFHSVAELWLQTK